MMARTAIIILNWNSGEMTAECIRSLLSMTASDYEIIVVDNGSKDGSADYLQEQFPSITILRQDHNLGFAGGCNAGIKFALERGMKYLLPLNNDTVVNPDFLSELERVAEEHTRAAMISPKIYFWDPPEQLWWAGGDFSLWTGIPKSIGRRALDLGQFDVGRQLAWATGCAVLIRCDVLREVGVFDERFSSYAEDLDLSLRVRKAGYEIWYGPTAKLWHMEGAATRKNVGEQMRKFSATRNSLYVMYKHANLMQWITFIPNFIVRHMAFYIALSLVRADFRSAWAVIRGVVAFPGMWYRAKQGI